MATAYATPETRFVVESRRPVSTRSASSRSASAQAVSARPCREGHRAAGFRFTRRARLAVLVLVALAVVLLGPVRAIASSPHGVVPQGWASVTVKPGDTLWSLAQQIDPGSDPRAMIAMIKDANGLQGSGITPGQILAVPSS